jgi:hypothetical protein
MRRTVVRILVQLSFAVLASFSADAQISDNVVKVGVLTDLSGPAATPTGTGSVVAAQMAADDFSGSVAGKPVVIVSADHQIKPDVGSAIARRWYDVEQVDVIVDVPVSAVGLAVQNVAKEKKKMPDCALDRNGGFSWQILLAVYDAVGIRYTCAGSRDCARSCQARRQHLVFPHCRLRLWTFARAAGV